MSRWIVGSGNPLAVARSEIVMALPASARSSSRSKARLSDWTLPRSGVTTVHAVSLQATRCTATELTGWTATEDIARQGTIHDSTDVDCRKTSRHMNARKPRLQANTLRNTSPSRPDMPTAAAAMARFCGETILPSTPPEELAAAMSVGLSPVCLAADTCSAPKSELDEVSDPVTATPSQPSTGEMRANALPAWAIHLPSEA